MDGSIAMQDLHFADQGEPVLKYKEIEAEIAALKEQVRNKELERTKAYVDWLRTGAGPDDATLTVDELASYTGRPNSTTRVFFNRDDIAPHVIKEKGSPACLPWKYARLFIEVETPTRRNVVLNTKGLRDKIITLLKTNVLTHGQIADVVGVSKRSVWAVNKEMRDSQGEPVTEVEPEEDTAPTGIDLDLQGKN